MLAPLRAAYMPPTGGVYLSVALVWLWKVDRVPLTRWDLVGGAVIIAGWGVSSGAVGALFRESALRIGDAHKPIQLGDRHELPIVRNAMPGTVA